MKKLLLVLLLMSLAFWAGKSIDGSDYNLSGSSVKGGVVDVLRRQEAAWNSGDIDAFMEEYWKSDMLRFASGGTVKYGWQTTLDRYKERYPDKETMGKLEFTEVNIEILSGTGAIVAGRWKLNREADTPNGLFTLHMRKENDRWIIVSDHTSSSD